MAARRSACALRRHALFYGPASRLRHPAALVKPSKANAATTVFARVGMAEPQRVSPKPSLAFLGLSGHDRCRETLEEAA